VRTENKEVSGKGGRELARSALFRQRTSLLTCSKRTLTRSGSAPRRVRQNYIVRAMQVMYGKTINFNLPRAGMEIQRANRAVIARSAFNAIDLIPRNCFPPIS
jgi:hypothetical protein